MVRLGESSRLSLTPNNDRFQFQRGAIGSPTTTTHTGRATTFQFQRGAIGSGTELRVQRDQRDFNSSVVRLGATIEGQDYVYARFQFQRGAIGSWYLLNELGFIRDFNSSVVRLGAKKLKEYIGLPTEFQFQRGAIGSRPKLCWCVIW